MAYTIQGTVYKIEAETSRVVGDKTYKSREIILSCPETINGKTWDNYPKFTAKADKTLQQINGLQVGQSVTLHFNIRGFNGAKGNFTGLEIWKCEAGQQTQSAPQQSAQATTFNIDTAPENIDDLPF